MASFKEINIPQKPPMVMVDCIVRMEDKTTVTSFRIRDDNVFLADGLFREPGLIENMAQTAAAGSSGKSGEEAAPPKLGFIGAIRDLEIKKMPKSGDEIFTKVTVTHEILNASVVAASITLHDEIIAQCELRIFLES
ncbi:MAG: 3-hydroxyacyl-ACP dehydratase [Bacteroidota bacterium]|jgi:3-hydroxyacyl-[acyl-carrier-protein] dehydratase